MTPTLFCIPFPTLGRGAEKSASTGKRAQGIDDDAFTGSSTTDGIMKKADNTRRFCKIARRLRELRELMQENKLDYYVIPSEDAHQNENVAEADKRLQWISGFTGNAGQAIVGMNDAYLVTDSRFWEQAERQLDLSHWTIVTAGAPGSPSNFIGWLIDNAHSSRVGIDAHTITIQSVLTLQAAFVKTESTLLFPEENFVDTLWGRDRPPPTNKPIVTHGIEFTGCDAREKLDQVREWIVAQNYGGLFESGLGNIAYVLNLRGDDVPYCPFFYSYLFIGTQQTILFVNPSQLGRGTQDYLAGLEVTIRGYDEVWDYLSLHEWGEANILVNGTTPYAVTLALTGPRYTIAQSIIDTMKAVKNDVEIEGLRYAYLRDGACFIRFFAWLEEMIGKGETITEWDAAERLTKYQRQDENFRGLKGAAMSCTGPNAALPHYFPTADENLVIDTSTPYLMDSGGQYLDGTCDTTRTVHFKKPTAEQQEAFTRVLQGHIAIDQAIWPQVTSGKQLDVLARHKLWQDGLNYGHGTGHSFGSFLAVHEGPHGFSSDVPLAPGNVITNEPAFYKSGHFGVRIESALVVRSVHTKHEFNGPVWLGFERLTCVPIQPKMCAKDLMSREEREWLKKHNRTCVERLEPLLRDDKRALRWLRRQAKFPLCF